MDMTKLLTTALLLLAKISIAQNYQQLPGGQQIDGAQTYFLPKAAFNVELYTVTKEATRGSQWVNDYSDDELKKLEKKYGVNPDIYKKLKDGGTYKTYSVAEDSIKISMTALPDFSKIFYTYPKKKWFSSQTTTFAYGSDGILTDAEASYENRTFDIVIKGISGLASVVGALKGVASFNTNRLAIEELDKILASYSKLDGLNNFDVYKDMKATLEKQYTKVFAEYFYELKTKSKPAKLLYCPSKAPDANGELTLDLFEIDTNGTLYYNKNLGDDIIWIKGLTISKADLTKPYKIKFHLLNKAHQPMEKYASTPTKAEAYFGFNVPAKTLVSILNPSDEELGLDLCKIAQFGKVAYVSAKKLKLVFQLDPLTGELKKLTTESKAITDDQVGNTATAITSAITTLKAEDADTKLEKEVKRLENEKKKRDLLKELGGE